MYIMKLIIVFTLLITGVIFLYFHRQIASWLHRLHAPHFKKVYSWLLDVESKSFKKSYDVSMVIFGILLVFGAILIYLRLDLF